MVANYHPSYVYYAFKNTCMFFVNNKQWQIYICLLEKNPLDTYSHWSHIPVCLLQSESVLKWRDDAAAGRERRTDHTHTLNVRPLTSHLNEQKQPFTERQQKTQKWWYFTHSTDEVWCSPAACSYILRSSNHTYHPWANQNRWGVSFFPCKCSRANKVGFFSLSPIANN